MRGRAPKRVYTTSLDAAHARLKGTPAPTPCPNCKEDKACPEHDMWRGLNESIGSGTPAPMLKALETLRSAHVGTCHDKPFPFCDECGEGWPCTTVRFLNAYRKLREEVEGALTERDAYMLNWQETLKERNKLREENKSLRQYPRHGS